MKCLVLMKCSSSWAYMGSANMPDAGAGAVAVTIRCSNAMALFNISEICL
jgi:hypothetical protein